MEQDNNESDMSLIDNILFQAEMDRMMIAAYLQDRRIQELRAMLERLKRGDIDDDEQE